MMKMEQGKCPLCGGELEFKILNRKTTWYCASCRAEGEVKKDNVLVIYSCSAKGSMCNLVSNY